MDGIKNGWMVTRRQMSGVSKRDASMGLGCSLYVGWKDGPICGSTSVESHLLWRVIFCGESSSVRSHLLWGVIFCGVIF